MAHPAHLALARIFSSPTLIGPPCDDKLVALVAHLFTPEEAEVAVHLPLYRPQPLARLARRAGRPAEELGPLLAAMAQKRVIYGPDPARGYSIIPLIPGMFEYMLQSGVDTDWHREYARMLLDLYSTGYVRAYNAAPSRAIRNIPVSAALDHASRAVTPDLIEEMIAAHELMGVLNVCQCRQSLRFIGQPCKRSAPEDGCLVFGNFAADLERQGNGRLVSRDEMRRVVDDRIAKKLVFMTGNVGAGVPNAICTCCDCCCHGLESINRFGASGFMAEPRFRARVDEAACNACGACGRACNTFAHTVADKHHSYDPARCVGCGLCVTGCKKGAISLAPNPSYRAPAKNFRRLGLRILPASLYTALRVMAGRIG